MLPLFALDYGVLMVSSRLVRTRWVDYKEVEYDASHIEPGW